MISTPSSHTLTDTPTIELTTMLDTISEFGAASRELLAWEFCVRESDVADVWNEAIDRGLVVPVGPCPQTGEALFALAPRSLN